MIPKGLMKPQAAIIRRTPQEVKNETKVVKDLSKIAANGNGNGIQCTHCSKTFSRALVLLDFKNGQNRLINVCPYCNHLLKNTRKEKGVNEPFHVVVSDEKITQ
jgi:NAD-dependent SIR2 family protein deacetylase